MKEVFGKEVVLFWTMVGLRIGENGPSYLAQGFIVGYVTKIFTFRQISSYYSSDDSFIGGFFWLFLWQVI